MDLKAKTVASIFLAHKYSLLTTPFKRHILSELRSFKIHSIYKIGCPYLSPKDNL